MHVIARRSLHAGIIIELECRGHPFRPPLKGPSDGCRDGSEPKPGLRDDGGLGAEGTGGRLAVLTSINGGIEQPCRPADNDQLLRAVAGVERASNA